MQKKKLTLRAHTIADVDLGMNQNTLAIAAVTVYLGAVLLVGLKGRKLAASGDMFNIFGRSARTVRAASSYLGLIGAGELLTFTQIGYDNGLDVLWLLMGFALGFLVLMSLGNKIRLTARERKINTLAGYFRDQFGLRSSLALSIVSITSLGSLLVIQFIVGADLVSSLTGLSPDIATLIIGCIIAIYLIPSGIVAVLSTDVLRAVMMTIVLLVIVTVASSSVTAPTHVASVPLEWLDRISMLVLGIFGTFCGADVWQTVLASEDYPVVRRSLGIAAIGFVAVGLLIAAIGVITKLQVATLGDQPAFIVAIQSVLPRALAPLTAVLVTGSIMATADTEIWVISSLLLGNFLPGAVTASSSNDEFQSRVQFLTRLIIPLVILFTIGVAHLSRNGQALYQGLLILLTVLGPSHFAIVLGAPTSASIATSLWFGIIGFFGLSLYFSFLIPTVWTLAPLAVSALGYVIGHMLSKRNIERV